MNIYRIDSKAFNEESITKMFFELMNVNYS